MADAALFSSAWLAAQSAALGATQSIPGQRTPIQIAAPDHWLRMQAKPSDKELLSL